MNAGAVGEAGVGVFAEFDFLVEDSGFDHEVADQVEVGFARGEGAVGDSVHGLGEGPAEECGLLVVVEAAYEVGGVLAVGFALVEPETGARDAVYQDLHYVRSRVDEVLADDEDAGHVVGPVVAGLEEDAAEATHLGL